MNIKELLEQLKITDEWITKLKKSGFFNYDPSITMAFACMICEEISIAKKLDVVAIAEEIASQVKEVHKTLGPYEEMEEKDYERILNMC